MMLINDPSGSVSEGEVETHCHITCESAGLLACLQQAGIRFAHWKGNRHLLLSLEGKTDIEILVHPDDKLPFESVLRKRSYKKLNAQPWNTCRDLEDWLGFDFETGNLLHLHTHYALVTAVAFGKYLRLPWRREFFRHLTVDKLTGWPIPTPEMEALVLMIRLYAHMVHKKKAIPGAKQKELLELLSRSQAHCLEGLCRILGLRVPGSLETEINRIIESRSLPAIIDLASFFYRQLPGCVQPNQPLAATKRFYYKHFLRATRFAAWFSGPVRLKKTLAEGGKIIALVGSDGAGKSTLCNDLIDWLTFKIDAHFFYLGKRPFVSSYGRRLFSLSGFLFSNPALSKFFRKMTGNFFYVLLIRKKLKLLRLARRLAQKNSLVICDRFPQKDITGFFDGPKSLTGKKHWLSRLEWKQFEKPGNPEADLVFRLNVSPKTAALRKPQHDYRMIERKCRHLSSISFGSAKVVDIDTERPYEQVLLDLKRKVWENL